MNIAFSFLAISWILLILLIELLYLISLFVLEKITHTKIQPTVSIIVAVWNEGERIGKCLRSLLKQNYPKTKTEIIVIGGGEKGTVTICQRFVKQGKIKFIHEKTRQGKWWALNKGIELAKNETLAFTDADCVLPMNWLSNLVSRLGDADIIISPFIFLSEKSFIHKTVFTIMLAVNSMFRHISKIFKLISFFGPGCLMKRKVVEKIKFKKSFIEDLIFSYEAQKVGFKIAFDNRARPQEAGPDSLQDAAKLIRRAAPAVLSELPKIPNFVSFFIIVYSFLSIFSPPLFIYYLIMADQRIILVGITFIIVSLIFFTAVVLSERGLSKLYYFPYLLLSLVIFTFLGIKETLTIILNKNKNWGYIWPIYNNAF
jgi:glycosyltransferase involved in cell wall biosynthesis